MRKPTVLENIEKMKQQREERRLKIEQQRNDKRQRELMNEAQGIKVDADFDLMIQKHRLNPQRDSQPHTSTVNMKISVCVRKRPIFSKEQ